MKRCSLREWIPILPIPVLPLAWQCLLGQNTVAGSMICSFWLCVEACQEEYVGIPIFITSAFHHGSRQRYPSGSHFAIPAKCRGAVLDWNMLVYQWLLWGRGA